MSVERNGLEKIAGTVQRFVSFGDGQVLSFTDSLSLFAHFWGPLSCYR